MKKYLLSILVLLTVQKSTFSQIDTTFDITFELQGGIGILDLLGSKGGILEMDNLGYSKSISDIEHSGSILQLGAIFSRRLRQRFWLRSGLQMTYLQAKAQYQLQENFDNGTTLSIDTKDEERRIKSIGVQLPILFEYRSNFESWGFYANLGTIWSYSVPDVERQIPRNTSTHIEQHGVAGTVGLGIILYQRNWYAWRIGYRLSADLMPFNLGNNTREKIYHPEGAADRDYRHLIHQLEFSFVWPEREIVEGRDIKDQRWTGWFLGSTLSFQTPVRNTEGEGRKGLGWGRNFQLKWIASRGFGLRLHTGFWIAPQSNNRTEIAMTKIELLYQLPSAIELSIGTSTRSEYDTRNTGPADNNLGLVLGAGGMIPLRHNFGLQLNLAAHYFPEYTNEKILMEPGLGLIYNVF